MDYDSDYLKSKRRRQIQGWIVGTLCLFVLMSLVRLIETVFDLPFSSGIDDVVPGPGMALSILAFIASLRIGMAAYGRRIDGGLSKKELVGTNVFFIGTIIYGIISYIFHILIKNTYIIDFASVLLAAAIFNLGHKIFHRITTNKSNEI